MVQYRLNTATKILNSPCWLLKNVLCCRKPCVMDISRLSKGSWSCWSGCAEPCRRREMTSTTDSVSSSRTKRPQRLLKFAHRSLWSEKRRTRRRKKTRRACHWVTSWRRRAPTKPPDHLNSTLHLTLLTKLLLLQQADNMQKHWAHSRTEWADTAYVCWRGEFGRSVFHTSPA